MKIKLDGLRWNNIDLSVGLPEDIKAKCAKPEGEAFSAEASSRVPFFNNLYVAQHNFVDTEPVANPAGPEEPLPLLPGQPMSHAPDPLAAIPTHAYVSGSTLADLITAATGGPGGLWTATTVSLGQLTSFTREGRIYRSIGASEQVAGDVWRWAGWGITYYTGIFRPALFSQYPPLSIGQMPVVFTGNTFVIDYAKTEIMFQTMSSGEVFLLHGEIK